MTEPEHTGGFELGDRLNEQQRRAVTHEGGPCLVLAGAGSGKTRVITYRIAWLIQQGVDPANICAVTFTNKAAAEMRSRVATLLGAEPRDLWLLTFHALGLRLLRDASGGKDAPRVGFAVYDRGDAMAVWRECQRNLRIDAREHRPRSLFETCSRGINRFEDPAAWAETGHPTEKRLAGRVYVAYRAAMARRNAVDFDDLLAWPLKLLNSGALEPHPARFQHFMVDEYQDTNRLQYRLVRALTANGESIMVVGDEDQSIYRWRGADIANVLEFERDFAGATTVRLEQNYRATEPILAAANSLVAHNHERIGKSLWTDNSGTDRPLVTHCASERSEAVWVVRKIQDLQRAGTRPREIAILYRTNAQSRPFEEELAGRAIPFRLIGGATFFRRSEVKDLLAYLRLLRTDDDDALVRCVARPPRGVGPARIATIAEAAGAESSASAVLQRAGSHEDPESFLAANAVPTRAVPGLAKFARLLGTLRARADRLTLGETIEALLRESGYREWLKAQEDGADRLANLDELVASAHENGGDRPVAETLGDYLDRAALIADADSARGRRDGVHLTSIHAAKGLEFDAVFVTGLEEGLFPHASALDDGHLEEERRLAYVAMTRARRQLFLSAARQRRVQGRERIQLASRFLREIDSRLLIVQEEPGAVALDASQRAAARRPGGRGLRRDPTKRSTRPGRSRPVKPVDPGARGTGTPATNSDLRAGVGVFHPMFGAGRVLETQGSGERLKVSVAFARAGTKHLIARFAKLELLR